MRHTVAILTVFLFLIPAVAMANIPPVADAGEDQTADTNQSITLQGGGSYDPDFDPLTYLWTIESQPAGSTPTLLNATTVTPTFEADVEGDYVISLVVSDGIDSSAPDTVTVTVAVAQNTPPIADAGEDLTTSSSTLCLSKKNFKKFLELNREFRNRVLALQETEGGHEEVYQLNINLFPLSRTKKARGK